ncbi:G-PROTEIN-RECEP-F1-2 domain-containing protein [Aphelenchoides bicaudatus]|nr:G-PROTEIN-RECEP-F1-2 domain-containing protein [Aphelenchoides bicaudatus]
MQTFVYTGFIPLLPNIMSPIQLNHSTETDCICGDIQEEDYSPLYAWFNYILIICLLPWLSIFGLLTNICNVFIFSRKRMITSANSYLFSLACSDFLVILTGVFIFWVDSARSYIKELQGAPYTSVYVLPLGYMAQTASIYFTVAAAIDCYVSVCWKSQARTYCSVKRARQIIMTIALTSIVYNSLRFPQFNLRKCLPEGSQETSVHDVNTFLLSARFERFYRGKTVDRRANKLIAQDEVSNINLSSLTQFCSLNSNDNGQTTYKTIDTTPKKETSVELARKASSASSATDDTITMIMVVILFLCCNTLALVVNLIETFGNPDPILLNLLSDASNFLVVFNSSVNMVIYFIFNKEYRDLFLHYYLMIKEKHFTKQKSIRQRPTEIYQNGSSSRGGSKFYAKAGSNSFISRKTDLGSRLENTENNSPVWHPVAKQLPNSNTTTTKLSPPEDEQQTTQSTCNGIVVSGLNDVSPQTQTPSSPFMPTIYNELELMDAEAGWEEDETIVSGAQSLPVFAPRSNGLQPYVYMAELKLSDTDQNKTQTTVVKPTTGVAHNNTGSNL